MHVYFSGIGGTGIGPLALVAKQAGFSVSGSDQQISSNLNYLRKEGLDDIHVGQTAKEISKIHEANPIDWFVYTSALPNNHAELEFCRKQGIKTSKRDEFIGTLLKDKRLKLIAVAGTQGKTTTTAMIVWLFKRLNLPISYSLGGQFSNGEMSHFDKSSSYFVYECDEYDRNFLAFEPYISIITGVSWDHHDIFPTRDEYQEAFREFLHQSKHIIIWEEDSEYLRLNDSFSTLLIQDTSTTAIENIELKGLYNRLDAWLAIQAIHFLTDTPVEDLLQLINRFTGLKRRMELLVTDLYTDYAHTPEKIRGAMSVALEMAADKGQEVVVVYEPHSNRRQHFIINDYKDCFGGATQVYWLPTYLAREDPGQRVIPPTELISHLTNPKLVVPAETGSALKRTIIAHLTKGDMVIAMSAGNLDDWLRNEFTK